MKLANIFAALALLGSPVAQGALVNPVDASSQYKAYPLDSLRPLSPAPAGYQPVHMEHYGRHGSRWLIEDKNYAVPVRELSKADSAGVLTPLGKRVLAEMRRIHADSKGRLGELTPLGAEQHRGIGRRMARNFPDIFREGTPVDARSTVVIRCILSMLNEIEALSEAVPGLVVHTDASEADMWYMNHHDPYKNAATDSIRDTVLRDYKASLTDSRAFLNRLISSLEFIANNIDAKELDGQLFEVCLNMPSHGGLYPALLTEIYSPEEIDLRWRKNNAQWFLNGANTGLNRNLSPTVQRHLVRNMLHSADSALVSGRPSANLRFGHETMVLSLAVIFELADYGAEHNDFNTLADEWQAYKIFPMACNVQLVLYQKPGSTNPDDALVKILLNEREMPVSFLKPAAAPYYYRWPELRDHILTKLSNRD